MSHAGIGSVSHATGLLLNSIIGVNPTQIPFNGTGPAMNALVAGQVDYMADQIGNVVGQVQGSTISAYAIATAERNPVLPDLPTTKEAGMAEFEVSAWNALFAPKGTSKPILTGSLMRWTKLWMMSQRASACSKLAMSCRASRGADRKP